jgi:hypothetical protein
MDNFYIHNAIRSLYPNVITIRDEENFDENNNLVEIDMEVVMVEAERLSKIEPINPNQSLLDIIAEQQAQINELKAQING